MKNPERIALIGYVLTNQAELQQLTRTQQINKVLEETKIETGRHVISDYLR